MSEEVLYKDIPGFPGYRIGTDGSVWSRRRCGARSGGFSDEWKRLKVQRRWTKGANVRYSVVSLRAIPGGKISTRYIHRLVLEAFVGPAPKGMEGCHNDGDTNNNRLGNLRWDTPAGNHADKRRHGTLARGSNKPNAKFKEEDILTIFALRAKGMSQYKIAARFNCPHSSIGDVLRREKWTHVEVDPELVAAATGWRASRVEPVKACSRCGKENPRKTNKGMCLNCCRKVWQEGRPPAPCSECGKMTSFVAKGRCENCYRRRRRRLRKLKAAIRLLDEGALSVPPRPVVERREPECVEEAPEAYCSLYGCEQSRHGGDGEFCPI